MSHTANPKGVSFTSYSWAQLGVMFRAARLAGNESLAAQLKQAIALRKEGRKLRKMGVDPKRPVEQESE